MFCSRFSSEKLLSGEKFYKSIYTSIEQEAYSINYVHLLSLALCFDVFTIQSSLSGGELNASDHFNCFISIIDFLFFITREGDVMSSFRICFSSIFYKILHEKGMPSIIGAFESCRTSFLCSYLTLQKAKSQKGQNNRK